MCSKMKELLILTLFCLDFGLANLYKPYSYRSATFQETPILTSKIACAAFCNCHESCSGFSFNNQEKICQIVDTAEGLRSLANVTKDDKNVIFINPASLSIDTKLEILYPVVEKYSMDTSVIGTRIVPESSSYVKFLGLMYKDPETVIFTANDKAMFTWDTKIYDSSGLTPLVFPKTDYFSMIHYRPISFEDKTVWFSGQGIEPSCPFVIYNNGTYEDLPYFPLPYHAGECLTKIDDNSFYIVGGKVDIYTVPYIWEFSFEYAMTNSESTFDKFWFSRSGTYKNLTEHPRQVNGNSIEFGGCLGHINENGEKVIFSHAGNRHNNWKIVNYYNLDQDTWTALPDYPLDLCFPKLLLIDNILFVIGGIYQYGGSGQVKINEIRRLHIYNDHQWTLLDRVVHPLNAGENMLIWKYGIFYRLP